MTEKSVLGSWGENIVADWYHSHGYRILDMNFRTRFGEIDVIAANAQFIVFCEVKLRKNHGFAYAREQVTYAKQQRVAATAVFWLQRNECSLQPRFDVAEIYAPQGTETQKPEINILENAFEAQW